MSQPPIEAFSHVGPALGLPGPGQIAFVGDDLAEAASIHGRSFGIRRWYRPSIFKQKLVYRGCELRQTIQLAVGYSGQTQIELIQRNPDQTSLFEDSSDEPSVTPHHLGFFVRDLETHRQRLEEDGLIPLQWGALWFARHHRTRVCYFDGRARFGSVIELIEHRVHGRYIGLPQWYLRLGALTGHVRRLTA